MKYKLKVYSIWEFGQRKDAEGNPHQEDSLYPAFGQATDADRTFILCDGMGGHDAGEVASATVCEAMSASIRNNGHDAEGVFTDEDLKEAVRAAFDALDSKDNGAEKKMGTTMTFLKLHNEGATIAHMGDSRVYHIRPGKTGEETRILHVTEDHSLVNDLVKIGELTREEARLSKQKNVITRAMQPNQERRPKEEVYRTADIKPGDYFYLCSDGMLEQPDMEDGTVLKRIFSGLVESDERRVEILRGATDENRDNHTALIIHVTEVTDPIALPEQPVMPTKHVAVVEEELPQNEGSDNGTVKTKATGNRRNSRKGEKRLSLSQKLILGITVIALCLLAAGLIKSCDAISQKDPVEEPLKRPIRNEAPSKPAKPVKPANQEQQPIRPSVQSNSETPAPQPQPQPSTDNETAPASQPQEDTQQPANVGGRIPFPTGLNDGSSNEVVNSDADAINESDVINAINRK